VKIGDNGFVTIRGGVIVIALVAIFALLAMAVVVLSVVGLGDRTAPAIVTLVGFAASLVTTIAALAKIDRIEQRVNGPLEATKEHAASANETAAETLALVDQMKAKLDAEASRIGKQTRRGDRPQ
jgi:uncharacterized integral membrane protein